MLCFSIDLPPISCLMIHNSLVIYMNAHGFGEADVCTQKNLDPAMQRIHHPRQHQHLTRRYSAVASRKNNGSLLLVTNKKHVSAWKTPFEEERTFSPFTAPDGTVDQILERWRRNRSRRAFSVAYPAFRGRSPAGCYGRGRRCQENASAHGRGGEGGAASR